jgi:uncharacterized protein YlxP (DUF503 family)
MHAAAMEVELRLRDVHSLKEKRGLIKAMGSAIRKQFPVGFAETDHQDLWQRAQVGIAVTTGDAHQLDRLIHTIRRYLDEYAESVDVLSVGVAYMEDPS